MSNPELMELLNSDAGGMLLLAMVVAVLVIVAAMFLKAAREDA